MQASIRTLFVLLLAIAPGAAWGQTEAPITQDEALARDTAHYARDYGVGEAEARRRLLLMNNAEDAIEALENELGDAVSGVYFENRNGAFRLVVRTVGPDRRPNRRLNVRAKGGSERMLQTAELETEFVPGARNPRRLVRQAMGRDRDKFLARFPQMQAMTYDERTGAINVLVNGDRSGQAAADAAAQELSAELGIPVVAQVKPVRASLRLMRGGYATYLGTSPYCTTAFAATNSSGARGMLTAGHCASSHSWKEGTSTYPLTSTLRFDGRADYGFLRGSIGVEPIFRANTNEVRTLTGRRTKANTSTSSSGVAGSYICYYGRASGPTYGQQCGEVWSVWGQPTYEGNGCTNGSTYVYCQPNFVEIRPATAGTYMECRNGDSGAPVFAYTIAWGILSGCATIIDEVGNDTYDADAVWYTSIDELYLDGYALIYG